MMTREQMRRRTRHFAVQAQQFVAPLRHNIHGRALGRRLIRSAAAVGANYQAACTAHSRDEFIARLEAIEAKADESAYWMEAIVAGDLVPEEKAAPLFEEADTIAALMAASRRSLTTRQASRGRTPSRTPHNAKTRPSTPNPTVLPWPPSRN